MAFERLLTMLSVLSNGDVVATSYFADKFEISIRTVLRDVDRLSSAGVPISIKRGRNGGVFLPKDYISELLLFTESDWQRIIMALDIMKNTPENSDDLISKLKSKFDFTCERWMEVDLSGWGKKGILDTKFDTIKKGIIDKRLLSFSYTNVKGENRHRVVKPGKMVFKERAWYLQAICTENNTCRTFKLTRLKNLQLLDDYFDEEIVLSEIDNIQKSQFVHLVLKFDNQISYKVFDDFDDDCITCDLEKNLIVNIDLPEDQWLYEKILPYGSRVQILAPDHIRENYIQELNKMLEKHK